MYNKHNILFVYCAKIVFLSNEFGQRNTMVISVQRQVVHRNRRLFEKILHYNITFYSAKAYRYKHSRDRGLPQGYYRTLMFTIKYLVIVYTRGPVLYYYILSFIRIVDKTGCTILLYCCQIKLLWRCFSNLGGSWLLWWTDDIICWVLIYSGCGVSHNHTQ